MSWQKWKWASGVLCDKRMPVGLKDKIYRTTVRPAVLYGLKCCPIKKVHVQRLRVAEMMIIRWMCGYMRMDRIGNGVIRDLFKVALIKDMMRETRLR